MGMTVNIISNKFTTKSNGYVLRYEHITLIALIDAHSKFLVR